MTVVCRAAAAAAATYPLPPCPQDEFELVGIILGLACYNNVIVDAHLPLPAYKKLMGLVRGFLGHVLFLWGWE